MLYVTFGQNVEIRTFPNEIIVKMKISDSSRVGLFKSPTLEVKRQRHFRAITSSVKPFFDRPPAFLKDMSRHNKRKADYTFFFFFYKFKAGHFLIRTRLNDVFFL